MSRPLPRKKSPWSRIARKGPRKDGAPKRPDGREKPAQPVKPARPSHGGPPRAKPDHGGPPRAKPDHGGPPRAKPGHSGPPRAKPRPLPPVNLAPSGPPARGEWLFTVREGAERDLVEEILLADPRGSARVVAPGLVASHGAPSREGRVALTFARQGFPVSAVVRAPSRAALEAALAPALAKLVKEGGAYALQVWVPDTDAANRLSNDAHELQVALEARLDELLPRSARRPARDLGPEAAALVQVCLLGPTEAAFGALSSNRALSLAPGGRLRVHVAGDRPSRAARKLAEAFAWIGMAPEPGEVCVDLGAAPGGWTWLLLERRAKVIAVDPGKLQPELLGRKGLTYIGGNAFEFIPNEPVDWLLCDMAFRPVEVARLLARWAQERFATVLVANFKLPMKRKAETVREIRAMLESGGWRGVRTRQLYHDREEITATARIS